VLTRHLFDRECVLLSDQCFCGSSPPLNFYDEVSFECKEGTPGRYFQAVLKLRRCAEAHLPELKVTLALMLDDKAGIETGGANITRGANLALLF
jgi:hypothetical protein